MAIATRPATSAHFSLPRNSDDQQGDAGVFTCADGVSVPATFLDTKHDNQQYRVLSLLGRGAFGRCYKVVPLGVDDKKNWACKTIDKSSFSSRKVIERVKYEIKVMKRLPKHENVVAYHHMFEDKERLYILMELCTSRTLHDLLLKRKRLTEFEARYFFFQLANGISALHKAKIIHRDIKHSNLLLDHQNRIKIADFGLSTILDTEADRKKSFLGTPNFLAPELVTRNGQGHSFGVDVWAAGVLLFFMLYGRPPFNQSRTGAGVNLQQLYHRIVDRQIEFPQEPVVCVAAKSLIDRLCCKKENNRVQADEICTEKWFLVNPDSSMLSCMPETIFERPIRTLQEYKELVNTDPSIESMRKMQLPNALSLDATNVVTAPVKQYVPSTGSIAVVAPLAHDVYGKRPSSTRQPLEPISERENRLAPANLTKANGTLPPGTRAGANGITTSIIRTRGQARALAEAEKENQPVEGQFERLKLNARMADLPSSNGYALRSRKIRNTEPVTNSIAGNADSNGHGINSRSSTVSSREDRAKSKAQQVEVAQMAKTATISRPLTTTTASASAATGKRAHPRLSSLHSSDMRTEQCHVEAEFGRVTKLSEEYIPSILEWKSRLQRFCEQTACYLQRSSSSLEAELGGSNQTLAQADYPAVGMYVLNWIVLTRYGLGFRLSDGTAGTLYNDNTSLLKLEGSDEYIYVRPFENRSSIGYYSESKFPIQLKKKQKLLHTFAQQIKKSFSGRVDRDICPRSTESEIVKCLLHALCTSVGMVFLLTGNVLQFNMHDHSKLFLYSDAHIFYKSSNGNKWHFDLRQGPAMLIRDSTIDIDQFLLCLEYAQKVLATWNLHTSNQEPEPAASKYAAASATATKQPSSWSRRV
ncbi:Cell cycle serine/threonine-protein kinase cdc5/MSD2 [Coemansia spiralis]|uniref:Serine/threonine-protein kinase n=2 Tax=Coemansia TaxID=4863 RepID=A0A9W8KW42_9FUNG|nr:Cell cycle serine/threonine-protein kinase cdc5/MSD2 [Coemansia umbellata]KAJ2619202.1 Cell cycle serine/threonine-protein kinase cdc5/MSD2 [Coemansia sp. RSA 1358]KAJ2670555.1 Cell cycle serine/threonine-protein kinase cdc5/MSD2 [Coemansia spiralis]